MWSKARHRTIDLVGRHLANWRSTSSSSFRSSACWQRGSIISTVKEWCSGIFIRLAFTATVVSQSGTWWACHITLRNWWMWVTQVTWTTLRLSWSRIVAAREWRRKRIFGRWDAAFSSSWQKSTPLLAQRCENKPRSLRKISKLAILMFKVRWIGRSNPKSKLFRGCFKHVSRNNIRRDRRPQSYWNWSISKLP